MKFLRVRSFHLGGDEQRVDRECGGEGCGQSLGMDVCHLLYGFHSLPGVQYVAVEIQ